MARWAAKRTVAAVPQWMRPQLTQLVHEAPEGLEWLHEIKFDGYRMHARLDRGVRLLTRTGLDWTHRYPSIASAVASLGATRAYLGAPAARAHRGGDDTARLPESVSLSIG